MNNSVLQDQDERLRALNHTQSFIVQAPAGSGKTELLTQRFLVLLSHINQPEEMIAITFTKKSAAEMRARIIHALQRAQGEEPEAAHAKQTYLHAKRALARDKSLGWNLLNNPNRLQIQTIDSLNAYLTRQLPLLSHFGAPLDIADHPYLLYREAVQEFLSHLEENVAWSRAIETLLRHLDNDLNKVENLLINMVAKRDQWLPYIALNATNPTLRKTLESHLCSINIDALIRLQHVFPPEYITELMDLANAAAQHLLNENIDDILTECVHLTTLPGAKISDKKYWLSLAKLLFTKEGEWRKTVNKNQGFPSAASVKNPEEKNRLNAMKMQYSHLIQALSQHEELELAFDKLRVLPEHYYQDAQWEILDALHDVLRVVVAQLKMTFQQHGKIDYIENAQAALLALGTDDDPTDITLALDYKIQHILIDEFQDTSTSQYRLLEKLIAGWQPNDGRTLFVVGDPMQSIYRFREAEVGLFIRARQQGIGQVRLEPLRLSVNFRSTTRIVNWVNEHFVKVFPDFEEIASGAVTYSPSMACQNDTPSSTVALHPFLNGNESDQAETIIRLIQQLKTNHPTETIAILVRSRTHLRAIIPALKTAGLSFRALDIDPLATRPVIQDLLALTRALLHPADRIAWLAILRAPWCGLSLQDLLTVAGDRNQSILWQQMQSPAIFSQLSPEGQIQLNRIIPVLKATLAARKRYPLRYWVEQTWLQLGGPACLDQSADLDDANAFFNLLEKVDESGDLPNMTFLQEAISQLYATANNQADTSLQIMTIHNAKGLEFDTVILPHLERQASRDERQLLQWMEHPRAEQNDHALIVAPIHAAGEKTNSIYDYIKRQQDMKITYEMGRLLYVAVTRAKKQLHLFFNVEENESGDIQKPANNSLLDKLWNSIALRHPKRSEESSFPRSTQHHTTHTLKIKRLLTSWENPLLENSFQELMAYHQKKSGFELPDHRSKHIGTVIHQLLQHIAEFGIRWWQQESSQTQQAYIKKQLLQLHMPMDTLAEAISVIEKAIHNTLQDPRGQWILQAHTEAQAEYPLSLQKKNLVIDRTFVDAQGIRWIIDYKSTPFAGSDIENFLRTEQKKHELQLQEYALAFQQREARPIRLGLYFPLLPAWWEWG